MKKTLSAVILAMSTAITFNGVWPSAAFARVSVERQSSPEGRSSGEREFSNETRSTPETRTYSERQSSNEEHRFGGEREMRHGENPVVIKMRRYTLPKPDVIHDNSRIIRDNAHISHPMRDERGAPITQHPVKTPPREHTSIVRNTALMTEIHRSERDERVRDRYYWHHDQNVRYCHYYDGDIDWFGFYFGPSFYWARYYGDHWWWFDVGFGRWVYWWDGYWWWPSPAGVTYVYVDNSYYPYNENGVTVMNPEVEGPASGAPPANEGQTFNSPDRSRMVQIFGSRDEAFLYDTSSSNPVFIKYLGSGVDKVRYSGGKEGHPLKILLDYHDGTFALFTDAGDPVDAAPVESIPPIPESPPPASPPPGQ